MKSQAAAGHRASFGSETAALSLQENQTSQESGGAAERPTRRGTWRALVAGAKKGLKWLRVQ
jgi:hypothetical protein